jgi:hypothetical protein
VIQQPGDRVTALSEFAFSLNASRTVPNRLLSGSQQQESSTLQFETSTFHIET